MEINQIFQEYIESTNNINTTINWYNLYGGHSLVLNKKFQNEILRRAINKTGSTSELSRKLNINRKVLSGISNEVYNPKIKNLIKILNHISYPLNNINNKIIKISGLKPKLPFNLHTKEGAEIRAAFLSDGHISKDLCGQAQYCALEKELHNRLIRLCKFIFGEFKIKTYFNGRSYITKFPSVIGNILELSGVQRGSKTFQNSYLPKDILLGNKEIQTHYLRRVFDDEGDVCFDKNGKRAVRITRSVIIKDKVIDIPHEKWTRFNSSNIRHNLLFGELLLLLKLGFNAKLYSEGIYKAKNKILTAKWRIQITQQDQLRKFAELINFNLYKKRKKLIKVLNSYKYKKLPNGEGKRELLSFICKLSKKKGFFRFKDLGKELVSSGRSYDLAGFYLKFFLDKEIIRKIERGVYTIDKY